MYSAVQLIKVIITIFSHSSERTQVGTQCADKVIYFLLLSLVHVTLDAVFLYASLTFLKVCSAKKKIFSFIGCQKNFTRTYYYHLNVHYFEGFGKYIQRDHYVLIIQTSAIWRPKCDLTKKIFPKISKSFISANKYKTVFCTINF